MTRTVGALYPGYTYNIYNILSRELKKPNRYEL